MVLTVINGYGQDGQVFANAIGRALECIQFGSLDIHLYIGWDFRQRGVNRSGSLWTSIPPLSLAQRRCSALSIEM